MHALHCEKAGAATTITIALNSTFDLHLLSSRLQESFLKILPIKRYQYHGCRSRTFINKQIRNKMHITYLKLKNYKPYEDTLVAYFFFIFSSQIMCFQMKQFQVLLTSPNNDLVYYKFMHLCIVVAQKPVFFTLYVHQHAKSTPHACSSSGTFPTA